MIGTQLKNLIQIYGKDKLNTFTKYPSILTLHELGNKGVLLDSLTTNIENEKLFATEKIDGTNVRILIMGDEFCIGSRENLIHYKGEMFYGTDLGIVEGLYSLFNNKFPEYYSKDFPLCVIYGELYGGKIGKSKNYGQDKLGFRIFNVVDYKKSDMLMLDFNREDI